jgi:hypothetical protein
MAARPFQSGWKIEGIGIVETKEIAIDQWRKRNTSLGRQDSSPFPAA